ncbi:MAG: hypothetical protein HOB51_00860 [Thaumarchaeota archaeon]|nr:hypothetical protein [Nitrososphaerota archaeon]
MVTYCKGLCCREESAHKSSFWKSDFYRQGVKYCRLCSRFMKIDSVWCPCCKNRVSSKSRRYKKKQIVSPSVKYPKVTIVAV